MRASYDYPIWIFKTPKIRIIPFLGFTRVEVMDIEWGRPCATKLFWRPSGEVAVTFVKRATACMQNRKCREMDEYWGANV